MERDYIPVYWDWEGDIKGAGLPDSNVMD